MRATLGAGLLLFPTMLVGVAGVPADAATGCESPDTTWVGPATEGGSTSWDEPSNWTNGVPAAESVVCIPATDSGPEVSGTASAGSVTLEGTLNVGTSLDVGTLIAEGGRLVGGSTTVTEGITGDGLTLAAGASVDGWGTALLGDWSAQGSRLTVHGDAVLAPGAEIDTLGGLFTITESGSLTFDTPNEFADVIGGFANHGAVMVTAGSVLMMGADPEDAQPDQFSTGTFTGSPEATFNVANTELRTRASLDHVTWVDHITVPADNTATVADSTLYWDPHEPEPNLAGSGELVVTDNALLGGRIAGSLTVTVPGGEVARMGDAVIQHQVRVRVDGELQGADIYLNDDAVLDVFGVHRVLGGSGVVDFTGTDPGVEIIHPGGHLLTTPDGGLHMVAPFVNEGTVDSGTGFIYLGPRSASPSPSSGTFRADPTGTLLLGSNVEGEPALVLDAPIIEGAVQVSGPVLANSPELRGHLSTLPGGADTRSGQLTFSGTTTLTDGGSVAGDVLVGGKLEADLGSTGTATLSGAGVTGRIHVTSGTLEVPSLATTTLLADGTLVGGHWTAEAGATLNLPAITSNDTTLKLMGPGASFGDGLAALARTGPNGKLKLIDGADLAVPGPFRNEGNVRLSPGSRFDVGGQYLQLATGALIVEAAPDGIGRVRAEGRRDLAGAVVVDREPTYTPTVDTLLTFLTSNGRVGPDDEFDDVVSPRFGSRKLRVVYERDRVRLQVDRVG